jgi:large subunit ribosomal protein L37Ae
MRSQKFGASIRKLVDKAIAAKRASYECPKCNKMKMKRKSNAVWECRSCGAVMSGGAYSFRTEAGEISSRIAREYAKSE